MIQKAAEHSMETSRCAPVWGCFETINADVRPYNMPMCDWFCNHSSQTKSDMQADFVQAGSKFERVILKHTVKARTWWQHMPYGDQAIFVRADVLR